MIVEGGRLPQLGENFYSPSVVKDVTQDMKVVKEETFGPLAAIIPFDSKEQVLQWCNDTPYGLASYIFSENLNTVWYMSEFWKMVWFPLILDYSPMLHCHLVGLKNQVLVEKVHSMEWMTIPLLNQLL